MKILIFGSNGQLGRSISEIFPKELDKVEFSREELSITNKARVSQVSKDINPDFIINCAAFTEVDLAEERREAALKVNYDGARNLATISKDLNCALIHFSTDYVYDGKKKNPYLETDDEAPLNYYGLTKQYGDQIIKDTCSKYFIFRLSGVFSPYGENFIKSLLRLRTNKSIVVVDDLFFKPTSARIVAKFLLDNLNKRMFERAPSGLYNFSLNGDQLSWNEFAKVIFSESLSMKLINHVPEIKAINADDFVGRAIRPYYSVMDNSKIKSNFSFPNTGLIEVLREELPLIFANL